MSEQPSGPARSGQSDAPNLVPLPPAVRSGNARVIRDPALRRNIHAAVFPPEMSLSAIRANLERRSEVPERHRVIRVFAYTGPGSVHGVRRRSQSLGRNVAVAPRLESRAQALRTVPATTNLRPGASGGNSIPRRDVTQHWVNHSVSQSAMPSTRDLSPLFTLATEGFSYRQTVNLARSFARDLLGTPESQAADEARRRRRRRRRRRLQAAVQAHHLLARLLGTISNGEGLAGQLNRRSRSTERRLPAQVPRRGNSVSDCSQCSSEEDEPQRPGSRGDQRQDRQPVPSDLEEWLHTL
ncbi:hypothetical protein KR018_006172 [Drosophila ironensis]|nr:hypothetical protein KR018_006172 [Drosophila ironensis]